MYKAERYKIVSSNLSNLLFCMMCFGCKLLLRQLRNPKKWNDESVLFICSPNVEICNTKGCD